MSEEELQDNEHIDDQHYEEFLAKNRIDMNEVE